MSEEVQAGVVKSNVYALKNFKDGRKRVITFFEMKENGEYEDGTTLEEMLRVSFARLFDLNGRFPCEENKNAMIKMTEALMWLNKRTEDRVNRGVEGKHEA